MPLQGAALKAGHCTHSPPTRRAHCPFSSQRSQCIVLPGFIVMVAQPAPHSPPPPTPTSPFLVGVMAAIVPAGRPLPCMAQFIIELLCKRAHATGIKWVTAAEMFAGSPPPCHAQVDHCSVGTASPPPTGSLIIVQVPCNDQDVQ